MYNRYIGNTGKYYRVDDTPQKAVPPPVASQKTEYSTSTPTKPQTSKPAKPLSGILSKIMPDSFDSGDLLLLILLLLLYNESGDEEYLIILVAVFLIH